LIKIVSIIEVSDPDIPRTTATNLPPYRKKSLSYSWHGIAYSTNVVLHSICSKPAQPCIPTSVAQSRFHLLMNSDSSRMQLEIDDL
jgi:hypothetical protein